jgi:hypothetical protein
LANVPQSSRFERFSRLRPRAIFAELVWILAVTLAGTQTLLLAHALVLTLACILPLTLAITLTCIVALVSVTTLARIATLACFHGV